MLLGWLSAIVSCLECQHTWAESLPPSWDGTPVVCKFCGSDTTTEVAESK